MPWPISPAPATKTRWIVTSRAPLAARPTGGPPQHTGRGGGRRRRPGRAVRRGLPIRIVQRGPQPIGEDRPDERLGTGEPRHRTVRSAAPGRAMPVERDQQLRHALARRRGRDEDLGSLGTRTGCRLRAIAWVGLRRRRDEHRAQLGGRPLRSGLVALVHDDQVRHLQQARLDRLDLVAHLGRLEDHGRVRGGGDLDFALAGADRLDEHEIEPGRIHQRRRGG